MKMPRVLWKLCAAAAVASLAGSAAVPAAAGAPTSMPEAPTAAALVAISYPHSVGIYGRGVIKVPGPGYVSQVMMTVPWGEEQAEDPLWVAQATVETYKKPGRADKSRVKYLSYLRNVCLDSSIKGTWKLTNSPVEGVGTLWRARCVSGTGTWWARTPATAYLVDAGAVQTIVGRAKTDQPSFEVETAMRDLAVSLARG